MTWRGRWIIISGVIWITWSIALLSLVYGDRSAVIALVLTTPGAVVATVCATLEVLSDTPTRVGRGKRR